MVGIVGTHTKSEDETVKRREGSGVRGEKRKFKIIRRPSVQARRHVLLSTDGRRGEKYSGRKAKL